MTARLGITLGIVALFLLIVFGTSVMAELGRDAVNQGVIAP